MKQLCILALVALLFSCSKQSEKMTLTNNQGPVTAGTFTVNGQTYTRPDHTIFVWFENKGFSRIVGSSSAPYINSLIKRGTLFTNTYAITHPSYPNYIAFFSGAPQGVTNDNCINSKPFDSPNLYTTLYVRGVNFRWYSENLPSIGFDGCSAANGLYREKHNPTTIFSNVPDYVNVPFSSTQFNDTSRFKNLPKVSCITPNMVNDMHDGSIQQGDTWLKNNLGKYVEWAMTHNSVLVVYWDESESSGDNRIPVTIVGQNVKQSYQVSTHFDHYDFLIGICKMWGAKCDWNNYLTSHIGFSGCWK